MFHDFPPDEKIIFSAAPRGLGTKKVRSTELRTEKRWLQLRHTTLISNQYRVQKAEHAFLPKGKTHPVLLLFIRLCGEVIVSFVHAESKGDLREIRAPAREIKKVRSVKPRTKKTHNLTAATQSFDEPKGCQKEGAFLPE